MTGTKVACDRAALTESCQKQGPPAAKPSRQAGNEPIRIGCYLLIGFR